MSKTPHKSLGPGGPNLRQLGSGGRGTSVCSLGVVSVSLSLGGREGPGTMCLTTPAGSAGSIFEEKEIIPVGDL